MLSGRAAGRRCGVIGFASIGDAFALVGFIVFAFYLPDLVEAIIDRIRRPR